MSILNSFKDITSSVFIHIQKLLNMNPSDISNDTKEKTKSILIEGQIQKQTERINKVLKERQAEIDKTRTPEEIQKAKDEFRQRMYKATSNLKKEDTLEK